MIYYEDHIENSPLVRNVRSQAATSEVTGSTPSAQTTGTTTGHAAEQQPNEVATRPPMRTSNDATTTETSRPTTRQTRAVTPMSIPPTDTEDNAHAGTNDVNAHSATRRRNTREFYESVPRDRRNPYGANPRRYPARQQRVSETPLSSAAPQQRNASERDDRAASESSGTTSRRTGASGNVHVPQSRRQGERDDSAHHEERGQRRADSRQQPHHVMQHNRDVWNRDVRDWRAVLGYMRYTRAVQYLRDCGMTS